ncbi:RND family efflux transporter MFP subunit [Natronospira proteinivora]|uniref:RND family efflux transporter MFP subunit n=1 Tax=Natronospira proteinivora TaxID=1807133 RepID=A0ABT1GDJ8_9GAMM|nr:efflux RND transporter periplasmic adaptor subunit [Natronospira proteinivora]MCP1728333.1 RND family efflux transporter MFP subunit [Natronospira proteinivora]
MKGTRMRLVGVIATGLLLAAGGLLMAWGSSSGEAGDKEVDARPAVRLATVRDAPALEWQRFPGVLRARERSQPAFLHPGTLAERPVAEGDRVQQGEILASLHNPSLAPKAAAAQGRVEELKANIRQYQQELTRAQALRERDLISQEEVDRLQARLDATREARKQAQANLTEAREQLAELQLRAPFEGEVIEVLAEAGDFVSAGQPIVRLAGLGELEVEIRLPATLAKEVDGDTVVRLSRPLQGGQFEARLKRLGHGGRDMAVAVVTLPRDNDLAPGQVVHVHFGRQHSGAVQVPLTAVLDPGGHQPSVYRVVESNNEQSLTVERVQIAPGRFRGDWVDVHEGLTIGDRVVIAGQGRLVNGGSVRVLP